MEPDLTLRFFDSMSLNDVSIRSVRGAVGLYFIYLSNGYIQYPFHNSRLIYIGMSESRQNSIGNRLRDHSSGQSGNPGLTNFISAKGASFTHLTFDFLNLMQIPTVGEVESVFFRKFLREFGCYPICNNQSGVELRGQEPSTG